MTLCPLCQAPYQDALVKGADERLYYKCNACLLIASDPRHQLSLAEESARYQTHQNSRESEGYVAFLRRLLSPMLNYMQPGMRVLDYGCGPGPTMSQLMAECGYSCDNYDPIFHAVPPVPPYDVVVSTEVLEHLIDPARDIQKMIDLISVGGFLGVMTELWTNEEQFATWYYTRDKTHVVYYHMVTLNFIAKRFSLNLLWTDGSRVAIFQKYASQTD